MRAVIWGLTSVLVTPMALAMPQYALKERKQCAYCHYDPKGGGPTNSAGRYYAKHFSLVGYLDKKEKKHHSKKTALPAASPAP